MPLRSLASEEVCFAPDQAKKLLVDTKYCAQQLPKQTIKIKLLEQSNKLQESEIIQFKTKVDLLIQDKAALSKSADSYKDLYTKTAIEKDDIEKGAPSRSTWFTIGGVTAAVLFIAAFFAVK